MSGQNFPNGFSLNLYRSQISPPSSTPQTHSRFVTPSNRLPPVSRHTIPITSDTQLPRLNSHPPEKLPGTFDLQNVIRLAAATPTSNLTVLTSSGLIPTCGVPNFEAHSVLGNIFQSLIRAQVPNHNPNLSLPSANVTGYVNTAPEHTSGRFVPSKSPMATRHSTQNPRGPLIVSAHSVQSSANNEPSIGSTVTNTTAPSVQPPPNHDNHQQQPVSISAAVRFPMSGINLVDSLFHASNLTVFPTAPDNSTPDKVAHRLSGMAYLRWAAYFTRNVRRNRLSSWPLAQADIDSLHGMCWIIAPTGLLGVYSESPFLRPILLLRRVQFAVPGSVAQTPHESESMVRTLRELADARVGKHPGFAPNYPRLASSVGFCTDFMSYVFSLDLARPLIKVLLEQSKAGQRHVGPEWRIILRLGWATSNFYVPPRANEKQLRHYRALVLEALPRCLSVRVAGRMVALPDPIFHGGQAQRLGKRLRMSIDITDKIPFRQNPNGRTRFIEVEVNWLNAPLEDQLADLLDFVASGQIPPLLSHLIGLPLIQVTFDRVYTIAELRTAFQPNATSVIDGPLVDGPFKHDIIPLMYNNDGMISDLQHGVFGTYDNCIPPCRKITAETAISALRTKLEGPLDDDLCMTDGTSENTNYVPICLLCPLTRTRIELPVRSIKCSHLQCFDLTSYLTVNRRRPRWSCPICGNPAPFRDLRLDELFVSILEDPRSATATFIHVEPDGNWRLAPEEVTADTAPSDKPPAVKQAAPNLSPISPAKPEVPSANEANVSPEKDIEVIILSDDDSSTNSGPKASGPPLISPSKRDNSEPPVERTKPPDSSSSSTLGQPSAILPTNPAMIEIDLTADDDSDETSGSMDPVNPPSTEVSKTPSNDPAPRLGDHVDLNAGPMIVISPLPAMVNGDAVTDMVGTKTNGTATELISDHSATMVRHLFDAISSMRAQALPDALTKPRANVSKRQSEKIPSTPANVDTSNHARSKRKPAAAKSVTPAPSIRPVSSYLDSPLDENVPGLDLSDLSDVSTSDEHDFVATTTPVFPGATQTGRIPAPSLKPNQAVALARLVQQRSCRRKNSDTPRTGNSRERHTKRTRLIARDDSDDDDDVDNDASSSADGSRAKMPNPPPCLSTADDEMEEGNDEEEESSWESESSDDRWSPSGSHSRRPAVQNYARSRAKRRMRR